MDQASAGSNPESTRWTMMRSRRGCTAAPIFPPVIGARVNLIPDLLEVPDRRVEYRLQSGSFDILTQRTKRG